MSQACLYVVATPIGHRDDLSRRAVDTLQRVDLIAAEDTRHSKRLLDYYQIHTPLISLHDHNEEHRITTLLSKLSQGLSIALISDAGTPLISDPGYRLVKAIAEAGYRLSPVPGACAAIAALSVSGMPTDRFIFEGFLPSKPSLRKSFLKDLVDETRTLIFYESPHRIVDSLADMESAFGGDRRVTIARELTKTFETIHQDTLSDLRPWVAENPDQQKGEFVLIVAGNADVQAPEEKALEDVLKALLSELSVKQAVSLAVRLTGESRKKLYGLALSLTNALS